MDKYIYILSCINLFISLLKPCNTIHRMDNPATHQIFCVLDVRSKKSLNPNLYFIASFLKFLQTSHQFRLIISYINLKYTFNIPFRITLKTIIMGTSSQFHDGAQLKFYPHFRSEILHVWIKFKKPLSRSGSSLLNSNGNLSTIQLIFSD